MKEKSLKLEKIIFYLLVFCVPLQLRHIFFVWGKGFNEWQGVYLYATDILVLALLVLWLWRVFCHSSSVSVIPAKAVPQLRDGSRVKPGMTFDISEKALLIFLFFDALSLIGAQNFWLGFYGFGKILEFAFLFLYLKRNFFRIFDASKFWLVFCSSAVLQSLIAIAQFFKQGSLGLKFLTESPLAPDFAGVAKIVLDSEKMIRAYGLTPHPNILAAILIAAIFGVGYLFLSSHSEPPAGGEESKIKRSFPRCCGVRMTTKIIFFAAGFILIFALFLTFSRAILIAGSFFFVLWLVFLWRISDLKKSIKTLFWIFVLCYMFFVACFWPFLSARFSDLKAGEQAVDLRLFLDEAALDIWKQNLILGAGQGNFVFALGQKFPDLPIWQFQPSHNIYLLIASETGLLGLLAFLAFLFLTLKSAYQKRNELIVSCFLFTVICLLFFGLTDHFIWDLQQGQLLFWIILGMLVSTSHSERSEESFSRPWLNGPRTKK